VNGYIFIIIIIIIIILDVNLKSFSSCRLAIRGIYSFLFNS
jgi:hypothetical protein